MTDDWISAMAMVLCATFVVLACLSLLAAWQSRMMAARPSLFAPRRPGTAFLFDGERLLDATPDARSLLSDGDDKGAWPRVLARLAPMFPGLGQSLKNLPRTGQVMIASGPDIVPPVLLRAEHLTGLTRLTMINSTEDQLAGRRDGQRDCAALAALQHEVLEQRAILALSPTLMWRESPDAEVIWANHAYMIRAVEVLSENEELSWPLPKLFEAPKGNTGGPPRAKLVMQGGIEWFDLIRFPQGSETLCYAQPANATVKAEGSLREFMQTLTKTFADLPIGLAIFDRTRVLQLFNPALVDLTGLPPEFLISRPDLSAVLDAMRAKAMLPEPKNYRSWRKHLMKLEEEAAMGLFEETWSLPGGRTYRVLGRPHPNGALAFMFEDISTEMTRTRRYRADLELGQSVIDAVNEAVAVFSQGGQLVMSSLAYGQLWNHDPAVLLSDAGITRLCAWWRDQTAPTLLWDDASDFVCAFGDRTAWDGEARLLDGRQITCRFRPLAGGATLITFRARMAGDGHAILEPVMPHLMTA